MNTSNILPLSSVEKILHDLPLNDRIKTDALRWLKHVGTDHRIKVSDLDGEFPSTLDRASVNRAINRLLDAINKAATTKGIRFAAEISPNKRDGAAGRWIWFTGALADPNPPNTRELNGARGKLYNPSAVSGDPPIVALMTFNENEREAVINQFCGDRSLLERIDLPTGVSCTSLGNHGSKKIILVSSQQGENKAQQKATSTLNGLKERYGASRVNAILAVGIAFGIDETKQEIGDVLVATHIYDYELVKKTLAPDGTTSIVKPRAVPSECTPALVEYFRETDEFKRDSQTADWPRVHFGILLSGNKLVDDKTVRDELIGMAGGLPIIGGEMEGLGVYHAATATLPVTPCIIIKAICDWGHGKNASGVDKEADQKKAAQNAARVVYEVLSSGAPLYPPIPPNETDSLQAISTPSPCKIVSTRPLLPDLDRTRENVYNPYGARGSQEKGIDREPDASEKGVDVLEAMKEWVQNKNGTPIFALLGEYGTGKTIACQRLEEFFRELRTTNSDLSQPLVLYFNLRNVPVGEGADRVPSLKDTLERCMRDGWLNSHDATIETIFSQIEDKTTVVIFDGLDEVLVKLSAAEGQQFARNLFSMAEELKFRREKNTALKNVLPLKILVSCRTHYFRTLRDQQNLFTEQERVADRDKLFTTMILLPLGEEQIGVYLRAFFPDDTKRDEMRNHIHAVHNLDELIRRPFLLKLVTDVLPKIEQLRATGKTICGVNLYEEFAKRWVERDDGKHHIEARDKPRLAMDLAAHFWGNSASNLSADEIEDWLETWIDNTPALKRRYDIRDPLTRARLSEDLRTANFLVRQDTTNKNGKIESSFRFAHTSFQESFLAKYLFTAVKDKAPERWNIPLPSRETLIFLGQLFAEAADETTPTAAYGELPEWVQTRRERVNELIFHYALTAKSENCPVPALHGINLQDAELPDLRIEGDATQPLNLSNANFEGANLRRTEFHHVILQGSRFANAALTQTIFRDCAAAQTVWNAAECNATIWRKCSLTKSTWDNATGRGAQFLHCTDAPLPDKIITLEDVWRTPAFAMHNSIEKLPRVNEILGTVMSCAWSPDGTQLLSGGFGGNLQVWEAESGKLRLKIRTAGHVNSCTWSPDGTRLLSGGDGGLQVWDAESGKLRLKIKVAGYVQSCVWSPDGKQLLSASLEYGLRVWDSENGKLIREIEAIGYAQLCAWSPDGMRLLGSSNNNLQVFDAKSGDPLLRIKTVNDIRSCTWSPDGTRLLSSGLLSGGSIFGLQVWDAESGKFLLKIEAIGYVKSCAWSPDGKYLLSSGIGGGLQIWDAEKGEPILKMETRGMIESCAWSLNGTRLLSGGGGGDGDLQVWDAESGKLLLKIETTGNVESCECSPDGKRLLLSCGDILQVWDVEKGKLIQKIEAISYIQSCAWSPDGKYLLSGCSVGGLQMWDAESGRFILKINTDNNAKLCAWSPDGTRLLSYTWNCALQVWDAKRGKLLVEIKASSDVRSCAWSPDGTRLFFGKDGGNWQVWNAKRGKLLLEVNTSSYVASYAWSLDGKLLLTKGLNGLQIWNVENGKLLRGIGMTRIGGSCAWSPNGKYLLSGEDTGQLQVRDVETGKLIWERRAAGRITSCAWFPDGKHLLSGDDGGSLQVWDAETGKPIRQFFLLENGSQLAWECATGKITHVAGKFWKDFHWETVSSDGQRELLPIEAFGPLADD